MPTAAKLFAAFVFAFVGFFAAEFSKPAFPEGTNFGLFSVICAGVGLVVGWSVGGARAERARGIGQIAGAGLVTAVSLVFWCFVVFAIREMLLRAADKRYGGVTDALVGIFEIVIEYGTLLMAAPQAVATLVVGGLAGGAIAAWGARRFR